MTRPAAGGGTWVDVPPTRLNRWFENFRVRHGDFATTVVDGVLTVRAFDDAVAECHGAPGARTANDLEEFVIEAAAPRRIGLILARKAAVAVGVADGAELIAHKVDTAYVQSRTAAGGWSQQRFARRRENQAKAAAEYASEHVLRVLMPEMRGMKAIVTGGDRRAVEAVLSDRRLAPIVPLISDRFLDVAEPRFAVLKAAVEAARSVRIKVIN